MPHIHDKPGQHDLTISICIVKYFDNIPKVLMHMHRKYNRLLPFGGHVELHETPWQAVGHELLEESGYELSQMQVLQPKLRIKKLPHVALHPQPLNINTHVAADNHFHIDLQYALVTDEEPRQKPDEHESQDMRWLSKTELEAIPNSDISLNAKEACLFMFEYILGSWEPVDSNSFAL